MRTALFVNIGNRDVQYRSAFLNNPRTEGQKLLKRIKQNPEASADFDLPILKPLITHLTQIQPIDHLFLFATDQTDDKFRDKDTLYLAEIIQAVLKYNYPDQIRQIQIRLITASPNDYDLMLQFYDQQLRTIEAQHQFISIYLGTTGGTPACNFALIFKASAIFGQRAHALYTSEKGALKSLNIAESITTELQRHTCLQLLEHYEFDSLAAILEQTKLPNSIPLSLCHYCAARLNFDFMTALSALKQAQNLFQELKNEHRASLNQITIKYDRDGFQAWLDKAEKSLQLLCQDMAPPNHESSPDDWQAWLQIQEMLLTELLINLRVHWVIKNFTFFIGLVFRFTEAVLHYLFEKETRFSADTKKHKDEFNGYLATEAGIKCDQWLSSKGVNKWLNNLTLLLWLEFYAQDTNAARLQKIHTIINSIQQLSELRNKSILAHGHQPVTLENIENIYKIQDILTDFEEVLTCLGIPYQSSSNYLKCSQAIIREALNCH